MTDYTSNSLRRLKEWWRKRKEEKYLRDTRFVHVHKHDGEWEYFHPVQTRGTDDHARTG
jgi:hypothetical protein